MHAWYWNNIANSYKNIFDLPYIASYINLNIVIISNYGCISLVIGVCILSIEYLFIGLLFAKYVFNIDMSVIVVNPNANVEFTQGNEFSNHIFSILCVETCCNLCC